MTIAIPEVPSQLAPTTASPGPLISVGASSSPDVERTALATPIAPAAGSGTVAAMMQVGSPYWDASHPRHEEVKEQVRQAFEQAATKKPQPSPFAAPSPGTPPAPAPETQTPQAQTFAPTDYDPTEVLRTYGDGTVDQKAASEFADFARKQGLTPSQYKAMVAFSAKEAERLADAGAEIADARTSAEVARALKVAPAALLDDPRVRAAAQALQSVGANLESPGFRDPQVILATVKLVGMIGSR